jgi:hypothetical protein
MGLEARCRKFGLCVPRNFVQEIWFVCAPEFRAGNLVCVCSGIPCRKFGLCVLRNSVQEIWFVCAPEFRAENLVCVCPGISYRPFSTTFGSCSPDVVETSRMNY